MDTTTPKRTDDLSPAQRSRVRARVRRLSAAVEEEGETSGELNLVPYLDILINTIIFLLATAAMATPLAHIKISTPGEVVDHKKPPPAASMLLTVAIGRDGFYMAGAGGVVGEGGGGPTLPCPGRTCLGTVKSGYDYPGLTRLARELKASHPDQRKVTITADREVPYRVVVATIDALRGSKNEPLLDQVTFAAGVK